jgi:hypothetical protein
MKDKHYLVNVDYYSKWVNVARLADLTSKSVVEEFRKQFADYGQVLTIRSDNGPQYSSREFAEFTKSLSIKHVTSSPGYARSNGLAERAVQTVKRLMIKASEDDKCFWHALQMFRNTPLSSDLPSPAQLLQGRNLYDGIPTKQHCLFPRAYDREAIKGKFLKRQADMKTGHDTSRVSQARQILSDGQQVRFRSQKGNWEKAVVVEHHNTDRSYQVRNQATGIVIRRNREHLKPDYTAATGYKQVGTTKPFLTTVPQVGENSCHSVPKPTTNATVSAAVTPSPGNTEGSQCENDSPGSVTVTRSGRVVQKPLRFRD